MARCVIGCSVRIFVPACESLQVSGPAVSIARAPRRGSYGQTNARRNEDSHRAANHASCHTLHLLSSSDFWQVRSGPECSSCGCPMHTSSNVECPSANSGCKFESNSPQLPLLREIALD